MKKENLLAIYNQKYAETYNHKFLTNPFSQISADFELGQLKGLVNKETSWLDIGCGTGYFLSMFPGIRRAGMDLSPDMLTAAKMVNPDALFFKEADFRLDVLEWHEQWSFITCMWYPYSYVESLTELEMMVNNMIAWVKPGGDMYMPVADLEDFRPEIPAVPYEKHEEVYGGLIYISAYTWTWVEDDEAKTHVHMIAPHIEHVVRLMEPFFETIEIVRYPPAYEGWVSRKAIVARNKYKKDEGKNQKANIIRHPMPSPANVNPEMDTNDGKAEEKNTLDAATHRQLFRELLKRLKNGHFLRSVKKKLF